LQFLKSFARLITRLFFLFARKYMPYNAPTLADFNALAGSSPSMSGAMSIATGPGLTGEVHFTGLTYLTADESDDPGEASFQTLQGAYERFRRLTGAQKSKWSIEKQVSPSPISSGNERHTFYVIFERVLDATGETNPG
jgi:hypothetical protein